MSALFRNYLQRAKEHFPHSVPWMTHVVKLGLFAGLTSPVCMAHVLKLSDPPPPPSNSKKESNTEITTQISEGA